LPATDGDEKEAAAKDASPGYERRRLTVFYTHLRGLRELSSEVESEELTTLLSELLDAMNAIIYEHGGTLDKFTGEGQKGFFGTPDDPDQRENACRCVRMALQMADKLQELNERWHLRTPLRLSVGINTGYVTLGNFRT